MYVNDLTSHHRSVEVVKNFHSFAAAAKSALTSLLLCCNFSFFYGKFGLSRPDLDGNKPAKGNCLAEKARDREVFN